MQRGSGLGVLGGVLGEGRRRVVEMKVVVMMMVMGDETIDDVVGVRR